MNSRVESLWLFLFFFLIFYLFERKSSSEHEQRKAASLGATMLVVRSGGDLSGEEAAAYPGGAEVHGAQGRLSGALEGEHEQRRRGGHQGAKGLARAKGAVRRGLDLMGSESLATVMCLDPRSATLESSMATKRTRSWRATQRRPDLERRRGRESAPRSRETPPRGSGQRKTSD